MRMCDRCGLDPGKDRNKYSAKQALLCDPCIAVRRRERAKKWTGPCRMCGVEFSRWGKRATAAHLEGHAHCSRACSDTFKSIRSSAVMADTNRRFASARMKARNPMRSQACRERVSKTLRTMGHRPPWTGGRGRGTTIPQDRLLAALGPGWAAEFQVTTGRRLGLPACIYLDLAHEASRTAIEVDGPSHSALAVKAADRRKERFLRGAGWTVLRFTNREVMVGLEACARTALSTTSRSSGCTPTLPAAS